MCDSPMLTSIYKRIRRYCSYQDRTQYEVRHRLRVWGVVDIKVLAPLMQMLRQERFIDDARYIEVFIRGKFKHKYWGKKKLYAALMHKKLPVELVKRGLDGIPMEDYLANIRYLLERKQKELKVLDPMQRQQRLIYYMLQKGYEAHLVQQLVRETY